MCNIKDSDKFFKILNKKLERFSPKKREDYLRKVFYLLRLRPKLNEEYEKRQEKIKMPFVIELESDPVYTKGIEKGIEKGQMEEKIAIARSLLEIHEDETIAKIVRLPIEDIKKLRKEEENK